MHQFRKYLVVCSLACFILAVACTPTVKNQQDPSKEKIDLFIKQMMDSYQIPGVAIGIVRNGETDTRAYGLKDFRGEDLVQPNSIFHMASLSKPVTATAIMQLVEDGKINLDTPLVSYLPYFILEDSLYKQITIRQILTHTSGIPDVKDYEWDKPQFDEEAAERYVRSLTKEKLIAPPGELWRYSNMAFDILAAVIAEVSGVSFEKYVKEAILEPLEMTESDFLLANINPDLRTVGHRWNLGLEATAVYPYNRRHAPSSCLNSTIEEMCHWAIANMNDGVYKGKRILDNTSYSLLFEPQVQINDRRSMGLSWFIEDYNGIKTISHEGSDTGYRTKLIMLPEKSLAVVVAINSSSSSSNRIAFGVLDVLLGREPEQVKTPISRTLGNRITEEGIAPAIEEYHQLKKAKKDQYDFSESQLNRLGYLLIRNEKITEAIAVFKLNTEEFPESSNTYDSLAEAYMLGGQNDLAIQFYKKSIELNPENENGIKQLQKLQKTKK